MGGRFDPGAEEEEGLDDESEGEGEEGGRRMEGPKWETTFL